MLRPPHRVEERRVLGRLHGDLREEHHVARQLRQPLHQLEPLGAQRPQLLEARRVALPLRHRQIGQRDRDRSCRRPARRSGSRGGAARRSRRRRCPRRAAAASGRRCARPSRTSSASGSRAPSAPSPTCTGPSGSRSQRAGTKLVGIDASAFVDRLQGAARGVVEHDRPDHVAVARPRRARRRARAPRRDRAWRGCRRRRPWRPAPCACVPIS